MLIIDMPKKYLTDASGFVSCKMCEKYLPLLHRDCHKDFKGCLIKGVLPDEHGRLVDADACSSVLRKLENEAKTNTEKLCYGYAARMFEEAFTIIAAERKDDGTTLD